MGTVIRMNRSACAPTLQPIQRSAAILEELAIHGFDVTVRGQDRNETRYPVNCPAQTSLAFTQRFFRPLALRQIEYECNVYFVTALFESRAANKHGNTTAVSP